jgi:hypothetical protein
MNPRFHLPSLFPFFYIFVTSLHSFLSSTSSSSTPPPPPPPPPHHHHHRKQIQAGVIAWKDLQPPLLRALPTGNYSGLQDTVRIHRSTPPIPSSLPSYLSACRPLCLPFVFLFCRFLHAWLPSSLFSFGRFSLPSCSSSFYQTPLHALLCHREIFTTISSAASYARGIETRHPAHGEGTISSCLLILSHRLTTIVSPTLSAFLQSLY